MRRHGQDRPEALASARRVAFSRPAARKALGGMELGYALSSEEHSPRELVANARAAEEAGFGFGLISDHIHPWIDRQGHSPFVWSVIGGIAQATERFRIGTGVTCPLIRIHPAIVAHAAATCACLMPGRFFLGVGTGENLNEHVHGDRWPAPDERLELLEEAVEVMRLLWQGGYKTHRGKHYTVEHTRIFDLPDEPIEVAVAAMQPRAAELAGKIGDSFVNVSPDEELVQKFEQGAGKDTRKYGQVTCCWAESAEQAKQTAWEIWPNAAVEGARDRVHRARRRARRDELRRAQAAAEQRHDDPGEGLLAAVARLQEGTASGRTAGAGGAPRTSYLGEMGARRPERSHHRAVRRHHRPSCRRRLLRLRLRRTRDGPPGPRHVLTKLRRSQRARHDLGRPVHDGDQRRRQLRDRQRSAVRRRDHARRRRGAGRGPLVLRRCALERI